MNSMLSGGGANQKSSPGPKQMLSKGSVEIKTKGAKHSPFGRTRNVLWFKARENRFSMDIDTG